MFSTILHYEVLGAEHVLNELTAAYSATQIKTPSHSCTYILIITWKL